MQRLIDEEVPTNRRPREWKNTDTGSEAHVRHKENNVEVALPKQLQEQLDQAAAIEAEIAASEAAPVEGNTEEVVTEPEVVEPQAEQPEPVVQAVTQEDDSPWKRKFDVLQGKYQAEVPRLHEQVRELNGKLQELIAKAEIKPAPVPETPAVTKEDEEAFGADLMGAVRRITDQAVAKAMSEFDKKVEAAVSPVANKLVQSDADRFWATVDARVPNFNEINSDPDWVQFLGNRIVGTGMTYRQSAQHAIDTHDAASLVEIVGIWTARSAPVETPARATPSHKAELAKQVAPTGRKDTAATPPQARVWTGDEYTAAIDPRNARRMETKAYEDLVASAELALAEGRVRW